MRWKIPPFTSYWVSVVTVAIYVPLLATLIYVHETLPSSPSQEKALAAEIDLDAAWTDLEAIAQHPHPYNSRENEAVRNYLLQRVLTLADKYPTVEVANDLRSNESFVYTGLTISHVFYVEGSNILVKTKGTDESLPAVLFSAHFDSSATAPGATDDGMGTVTLLSLIEQFARDPPLRTTIFNLNNGEEDGLCGSQLFFGHPWSKLADIFLNLEGAGSGGRPILFRGSTVRLVETFKKTSRPHGTVTSSDAYTLGLIRSQTDFEIYASKGGMKGLDATFYVNRDKYHTMADTVESLKGRAPLWSELQMARDVGRALANLGTEVDDEKAVYWDILGSKMIVFGISELAWRLPRLLLSTTLVILGMVGYLWSRGKKFTPTNEWSYFPLALLSGIVTSVVLTFLYCKINPMIIYSSPYPVLLSIFAALALALLFPLHYLGNSARSSPNSQRTLVSAQYFIFISLLLLGFQRMISALGFTGFYFIGFLYGSAAFVVIIDTGNRVWVTATGTSNSAGAGGPSSADDHELARPLLQPSPGSPTRELFSSTERENFELYNSVVTMTWLPALVVNIIPPLVLVCPLVLIFCAGLGQTLADGSAPIIVYGGLMVFLFLAILPLAPFAHQISMRLFMVLGVMFALTVVYSFVSFPFSPNKRVKFFYSQHLDLDTGKNTVQLLGVQPYLQQALLGIPSANDENKTVTWSADTQRNLGQAEWEGPLPRLFASLDPSDTVVMSTAKRLDANTAVFTVKGKDTKSCIITFDQNVMDVQVRREELAPKPGQAQKKSFTPTTGTPKDTPYSIPSRGVPAVQLYSREWGTEFEVTVRWNSTTEAKRGHSFWRSLLPIRSAEWPERTGRIGCQWADNQNGELPALNELFDFLPKWATITVKKSLLIADRAFSI